MKYVITDRGEVEVGMEHEYHRELAGRCEGWVIAAGHYKVVDRFAEQKVEVYGESIGFGIAAKPEDANALEKMLGLNSK